MFSDFIFMTKSIITMTSASRKHSLGYLFSNPSLGSV